MKGRLGYGRYDDDPGYIGCPRAQTDMTPCIARDGHTALARGCVGCDALPVKLLHEVERELGLEPSTPGSWEAAADQLRDRVRELTETT